MPKKKRQLGFLVERLELRDRKNKVRKKMLDVTVMLTMTATFLLIHATSWAQEKGPVRPFGPDSFRMDRLFTPEHVIDSNPAASGVHGNNVPNLKRWNAILFQASVTELRRQGPGTSPTGKIVSGDRQKAEPTGRIR